MKFDQKNNQRMAYRWIVSAFMAWRVFSATPADAGALLFEPAHVDEHGTLFGLLVPVGSHPLSTSETMKQISTDRYGHAIMDDGDRNHEWVSQGTAIAYSDIASEQNQSLFAAEVTARTQRVGLWKNDAVAIPHQQAKQALNHYALIVGMVEEVSLQRAGAYINFGADWKKDFTIYVPKKTVTQMDSTALVALKGKEVLVRGYVHSYYGPRITLLNPQMMEVMDESKPTP